MSTQGLRTFDKDDGRKCLSPQCPHFSCADSYNLTSNSKSIIRVSRNDHFCALHLHVVGSFVKATQFKKIRTLCEYSSLHMNGLGNSGIINSLGEAAHVLTCSSASRLVEMAVDSLSNISIGSESALDLCQSAKSYLLGLASKRYTLVEQGFPLGSVASAVHSYCIFKRMPVFREKGFVLEHSGDPNLPIIITIDGFLHTAQDSSNWSKITTNVFPKNTWVSLQWDASSALIQEGSLDIMSLIASAKPIETAACQIPGLLVNSIASALSCFQIAQSNCEATAYLLADAIARLDDSKSVILMGHSLGASLIYHALCLWAKSRKVQLEIGKRDSNACAYRQNSGDSGDGWALASSAVSRNIVNLYSHHDEVLNALGTVSGVERAGVRPIEFDESNSRQGKVVNVRLLTAEVYFEAEVVVVSLSQVVLPILLIITTVKHTTV
ncbi:hypothetical protein BDR26DRAFT_1005379 [Obelidium mucronatum]|nr:hypothetical protein BDR26DRAFT_1005379 [Obelidium mucronatum]